jgi:hypothetical protein
LPLALMGLCHSEARVSELGRGEQEHTNNGCMGKQNQLEPMRFCVNPGRYSIHSSFASALSGLSIPSHVACFAKSGTERKGQICYYGTISWASEMSALYALGIGSLAITVAAFSLS